MTREHHERIDLSDTLMSAVIKLAEGNPGALRACVDLMKAAPEIDPDSAPGALTPLLDFDTNGIYGPRIWMFYSDVCGCDAPKALALLRSWQLGFTPFEKIDHAIDNYGDGLDLDAILAQVKERLPRFAVAGVAV